MARFSQPVAGDLMIQPSDRWPDNADPIVELLARGGVAGAAVVGYGADTTLFEPHEAAQHVFYVQSGQVRIYTPTDATSERLVSMLGDASWFGIAALAGQATYGMRARAFARSTIWSIPAPALIDRLCGMPELAARLVGQLSSRLLKSYVTATRLMLHDRDGRIVQTLLDLSTPATASPHDDRVELEITHQELAQAIGAVRETVTIALKSLRRQNIVRTRRKRLMFNRRELQQFVDKLSERDKQRRAESRKP
jgi:CRP-like cAMP-binding protein